MISTDFATKFVQRLSRQVGIDVSIINEHGIIIESSSPSRVGCYCAPAHKIITGRQQSALEFNDDSGDTHQYGICQLIMNGVEILCAAAVYGDPASAPQLLRFVKFTLESMIAIDSHKHIQLWPEGRNRLTHALLFEDPINLARIRRVTKEFGYQEGLSRLPIYLHLRGRYSPVDFNEFLKLYQASSDYHAQDIALPIDSTHMLLCMYINNVPLADYRDYATELCLRFMVFIREIHPELVCHFCYWVPTRDFLSYRAAYAGLAWLNRNTPDSTDQIQAFQHRANSFLLSHVSINIFEPIFTPFAEIIQEKMGAEMFITTIEALYDASMNIPKAASLLFIHRNTLSIRMQKIKGLLNVDPFHDYRDASFLFQLCEYMKRSS